MIFFTLPKKTQIIQTTENALFIFLPELNGYETVTIYLKTKGTQHINRSESQKNEFV